MRTLAAVLLALLIFPAPATARESVLSRADEIFATRTETSGAAEALALYEQAATESDAAAPRWKAAKALLWLGDHAPRREKRAFYERGIALGEEAVLANPESPDARFWLGALYGSYGELRGVMKSLKLLKPIRQQMEEINRIDEGWGGGAGLRVLGVVDYKVPAIAGGSRKRALELLARALDIDAENPFNNYYMAECLLEAGRKDEALSHLKNVAMARISADVDGPDLKMIQEKALALEKKIAG